MPCQRPAVGLKLFIPDWKKLYFIPFYSSSFKIFFTYSSDKCSSRYAARCIIFSPLFPIGVDFFVPFRDGIIFVFLKFTNNAMKKIMILPLVICLAGLSNAQPTDSPELLKKALTSYFTGIENKDFALMKAVTTDDFQLYEDGLVWNNDS